MKKSEKIMFAVLGIIIAVAGTIIFCESLPPHNGETDASLARGKEWLYGAVFAGMLALAGIWYMSKKPAS